MFGSRPTRILAGLCVWVAAWMATGCQMQRQDWQTDWSERYPRLALSAADHFDPVFLLLQRTLKKHGTTLVPEGTSEVPVLFLSRANTEHTALSYSVEGDVRQQNIRMSLSLRLEQDGVLILPERKLQQSREHLQYVNQDLADAQEEQRIHQELRDALVHQILLALSMATPDALQPRTAS